MRGVALFLCALCFAWGMDEADVERDIAQTRSVEALSLKMHDAPKEYRHRYVEAIKVLVAQENEEKRNAMLNSLTGKGVAVTDKAVGAEIVEAKVAVTEMVAVEDEAENSLFFLHALVLLLPFVRSFDVLCFKIGFKRNVPTAHLF